MLVTNLRHLARPTLQHTVVAVHEHDADASFWRPELERLGVPVRSLGARTRLELFTAGLRLGRWAREAGVEVFHAHLLNSMMVGRVAAAVARVPLITTLHSLSYEPEILAEFADPTSRKHDVARLGEGLLHSFVDTAVIAVGETVAESARKRMHVRRSKLDVIPVPLDLSRRSARPAEDRARIRRALGLKDSTRLLLHVGRVVPLKGHLDVVRALDVVRRRGLDVHFVAVGPLADARFHEQLIDETKRLGLEAHVTWHGPDTNVGAWHVAADAFVFPSRYEGLPIALVEALAAGLPSVASSIPSNREVLERAGVGASAPPGDAEALAERLVETLEDLEARRARALAAAPRIVAHHDPARVADLHAALYERVSSTSR